MECQCCFCATSFETAQEPHVHIRLWVDGVEGAQGMLCHVDCLRKALDASVPLLSEVLESGQGICEHPDV